MTSNNITETRKLRKLTERACCEFPISKRNLIHNAINIIISFTIYVQKLQTINKYLNVNDHSYVLVTITDGQTAELDGDTI